MKYEETAKRLRQAMQAKGLRQQDLADLSGVSKSNISHYVNGNHVPDNVMAYKLARVLDVEPSWLMAVDEVPDFILMPNTELIKLIKNMDDDKLNRLLHYAKYLNSQKGDDNEIPQTNLPRL